MPAMALFILFSLYPFLKNIELTFFEWDGVSPHRYFVGLGNYVSVLFAKADFWRAARNVAFLTVVGLILQNGLSLVLAVLVDRKTRGASLYRVVYFIPPMLPAIVVAFIWRWILDADFGILNQTLKNIGFGKLAMPWLGSKSTALAAVSVVNVWSSFGYAFVLFLAGLQGIPKTLYEAAKIDGANEWQLFSQITIPLLIPVMTIVSILTILGAVQSFDMIYILTRGSPAGTTEVPALLIFLEAFEYHHFGLAATMAVILGIILFVLSLIQIKLSKRLSI